MNLPNVRLNHEEARTNLLNSVIEPCLTEEYRLTINQVVILDLSNVHQISNAKVIDSFSNLNGIETWNLSALPLNLRTREARFIEGGIMFCLSVNQQGGQQTPEEIRIFGHGHDLLENK